MQIVTLVVAVWGAALSTLLAIREIWLDRPRLVLSAWPESRKISSTPMSHLLSIIVSVDNRSRKPIWINEVGWSRFREDITWTDTPGGYRYEDDRVDLPLLIEAGARLKFPVWAAADSWPDDMGPGSLTVGVRSGDRKWLTRLDPEVMVTG